MTAMNRNSYRHRITTWTAILAVLMSLLAPGISHAVFKTGGSPHGSDAGQFESTLADSHHAHQAPAAGPANKHLGKVTLHLQHCAYCVVHAGSFGLMPSAAVGWNLPALAQRAPEKHVVLPLPTSVWAIPQSRAPPAA